MPVLVGERLAYVRRCAAVREVPGPRLRLGDARQYVGGVVCFFFQAEDGIRDLTVTGVQTCALPILPRTARVERECRPCDSSTLVDRLCSVERALDCVLDDREIGEQVRAGARRQRSEERRVGKECRSRWSPYH